MSVVQGISIHLHTKTMYCIVYIYKEVIVLHWLGKQVAWGWRLPGRDTKEFIYITSGSGYKNGLTHCESCIFFHNTHIQLPYTVIHIKSGWFAVSSTHYKFSLLMYRHKSNHIVCKQNTNIYMYAYTCCCLTVRSTDSDITLSVYLTYTTMYVCTAMPTTHLYLQPRFFFFFFASSYSQWTYIVACFAAHSIHWLRHITCLLQSPSSYASLQFYNFIALFMAQM